MEVTGKSVSRKKTGAPVKPGPHHEPGPCLNCGTYLSKDDLFCFHCGQKRLEREDLSFRHLIGDSFLDYFHFDSKFFRTILPLLYKPGWLTLEYMSGKRKSYVEPFKLFLVISVIYFLLLPFGKEPEAENTAPVLSGSNKVQPVNDKSGSEHTHFTLNGLSVSKSGRDSIKEEIDSTGVKRYVEKHFAKESIWTKLFVSQVIKLMISSGQSFTTVLEHTASKLIFLLIPFFAALLKLFYIRRKRLYFEHLIFSLHLHAFIFLMLILYLLVELIFPVNLFFIAMIILVYGFIALKKYYGQGFGKSLAKMLMISLSYLIIGVPLLFMLLILVALFSY
ncbi:MAG: DUF3667 domain-containing protein [Bacteroidetes bacterium]|nr:DUF3667 domain-containing protein [Bacteroidota bacterium]